MPSKRSSSKKKTKGKKKVPVDPNVKTTLAYQTQLNEEFYIPKNLRQCLSGGQKTSVDCVIDVTMQGNPVEAKDVTTDSRCVPSSKLKQIVHGVGLLPDNTQLQQIELMTAMEAAKTSSGSNNEDSEKFLDREKLRNLLQHLLGTRVLVVDPTLLTPEQLEKESRLVSVVYRMDEGNVKRCFEALWDVTGRRTTSAPNQSAMRCINEKDMKAAFAMRQGESWLIDNASGEIIEVLFGTDIEWEDGNLREDAFLLKFLDV